MRWRITAAAVVLIAVAALALLLWANKSPHERSAASNNNARTGDKPATTSASAIASTHTIPQPVRSPIAAPAQPFTLPDEAALREIDQVSLMIRDYRTFARENPVGTNAEIMEAIMGKNAKGATFGPPEGMQLNENGELTDRWGTAYFFHQLSRDHMEIRSAGADKVMWTDDDAVVK